MSVIASRLSSERASSTDDGRQGREGGWLPTVLGLDELRGERWADFSTRSETSCPPVVVRLAGLPMQAIEPLSSSACCGLLQAREAVIEELAQTRSLMMEAIGAGLPQFKPASRRFLLLIKRRCYNGREISLLRKNTEWADLLQLAPDLTDRIVELEAQFSESELALAEQYEREFVRERKHILKLVQDRRFMRGVALGRLGLAHKVCSQATRLMSLDSLPRVAKWEQSLLRFATRAAVKLSVNSTLTTYALGSIQNFASESNFQLVAAPQCELSLVRVNRRELEQLQVLLMRHPVVREHALLAWNDSIEEIEPGQYRFMREGYWDLEDGKGVQFVPPARIKVRLSEEVLCRVRETLRRESMCYSEVLSLLGAEGGSQDQRLLGFLNQLIDLGVIILMPPWRTHEPWLEQRIRNFIRTLTDQSTLQPVSEALDELLMLERSFASSTQPEEAVSQLIKAFDRLLSAAYELVGKEKPIEARVHFFEDVLLGANGDTQSEQGILTLPAPAAREILYVADLVSRFAGLFNHRHDVLHTLAVWWKSSLPGKGEARFLDIARGFAPLWKKFVDFRSKADEDSLSTFDPLRSPAIEALLERREALLAQARELLSSSSSRDVLPPRQFEEFLATLPRRYAPLVGSSAFVQPVDCQGSSWVLNRLSEGTGRYLSRITPVLPLELKEYFLEYLGRRSVVEVDGEPADLLEVKHPSGNLVSAHEPQTARVLETRGLHLDLPAARKVRLGDLTIQADLHTETFRIVDTLGRRVLPVHLSSMTDAALPSLLRFLLMFGPGETRGLFPFAHSESDGEVICFSRLTCGRLVLRRRHWRVDVRNLIEEVRLFAGYRAYAHIHDWRRRVGLPQIGFYYEKTSQGGFKPQFVDFSSPSLCSIFVLSLLRKSSGQLIIEEALPAPYDFPLDGEGGRRGVEILIDSLTFHNKDLSARWPGSQWRVD